MKFDPVRLVISGLHTRIKIYKNSKILRLIWHNIWLQWLQYRFLDLPSAQRRAKWYDSHYAQPQYFSTWKTFRRYPRLIQVCCFTAARMIPYRSVKISVCLIFCLICNLFMNNFAIQNRAKYSSSSSATPHVTTQSTSNVTRREKNWKWDEVAMRFHKRLLKLRKICENRRRPPVYVIERNFKMGSNVSLVLCRVHPCATV